MDYSTPFDFMAAGCGRETFDVRFSYFSQQEIHRVSVKQIRSIDAFSDIGAIPTESGLYANELGPLEGRKEKGGDHPVCPTCGLDKDCPGHMGHIDLACPCYNPFLFQDLFKLLRRTCLSCSRLKMSTAKTERTLRALQSLAPGELAQSAVVPAPSNKKPMLGEAGPQESMLWLEQNSSLGTFTASHSEPKDMNQQMASANLVADSCLDALEQKTDKLTKNGKEHTFKESACLESFRTVLTEYLKDFPAQCANCKGKSAKWRKDGYTKLFVRKEGDTDDLFCMPQYAKKILRDLWENESGMLRWMIPGSIEHGFEIYFLDCMLVPPNRFRPPSMGVSTGGSGSLHDQTIHLREVLVYNERVRLASQAGKKEEVEEEKTKKRKLMMGEDAPIAHVSQEFQGLQEAVNSFLDSTKGGKNAKLSKPGVRQLLEKKEGMFRMKMMGKRVNQAARSVISPDPNIETTEIGVPQMIAEVLTYSEVANSHNHEFLTALIIRGNKYPGCVEVHSPKLNGSKRIWKMDSMKVEERENLCKQLMTDLESGLAPMTVLRHIVDGDPLLVNRQPTLHKPGIMAHIAKVMGGNEKTIRMHYANCSTYNADFDGDEMNLHAPQDPISRVEALSIAKPDLQYLVPTSGKPLRGLIQDHVIGGVMLTRRDSYLCKSEVCTLLYVGLRAAIEGGDLAKGAEKTSAAKRNATSCKRYSQKTKLHLDPPTLLKPRKMWSGKQVLTMLLKNIFLLCGEGKTVENSGLNFNGKAKTPGDIWNGKLDGDREENTIIMQDTELLMGVLDKNSFGSTSYGLIHSIFELLGPKAVGMVLASFARLFSAYLQMRGFTCAFADLNLTDKTEENRRGLIAKSRRIAQETIRDWLVKHEIAVPKGEKTTSQELSKAGRGLIEANRSSADALEASMLGRMRNSWTSTIDACVPIGQKVPFPRNCMSAMIQTGAKGSKVNQSQISCLLGQQELEGRQPPLMPTRRSLPCFAAYDLSSRTRGYITDRFLTGIRPQEFFFHCMAGREGLVDTAVKTSRSGYLQRCLVKHLESLKVCYDLTVRDGDGTVVQFLYGDDGQDVTVASHLFKFDVLFENFKLLRPSSEKELAELKRSASGAKLADLEAAAMYFGAQRAAQEGNLKSAEKQLKTLEARADELQLDDVARQTLRKTHERIHELRQQQGPVADAQHFFDPVSSVLSPAHFFGATSELHENELQKYLAGVLKSGRCSPEDAEAFSQYMRLKFMKSLSGAGEAVGVIAAQSMGEPSTQMTLNTFHLAGHGGANVTLGIPRLREIVQTASANQSSPLMKVEVLADLQGNTDLKSCRRYAGKLAARFRRVRLLDIVREIRVDERVRLVGNELVRSYHCRFEFWSIAELEIAVPHLSRARIEEYMSQFFVRHLRTQVQNLVKQVKGSKPQAKQAKRGAEDVGNEAATGTKDDNEEDIKDDSNLPKKKRKLGRGERDGDEKEEAIAVEEERNAKDNKDEDDGSEASGMYASSDSEKEPEQEDDADEDDDAKQKVVGKGKTESADMGAVDEDGDEDMEEELAGKTEIKAKEDNEDGKKRKKGKMSLDGLFQTAAESGSLVWAGKLEDTDAISIVVSIRISQCSQKLLVGEVVRKLSEKLQFQDPLAADVEKVHIQEDKGKVWLECEGTNFNALMLLPMGTVDVDRITTNDIARVLKTYGVEAARANIVKEIRSVFGHYGIEVNHRHLSLIADFMSQSGGFRPFNRRGMVNCTSPFLQMSFETTMQFCQAACQDRVKDSMQSPASAIIVGQPAPLGTGMVNLMVDLDDMGNKAPKTEVRAFNFS